MWNKKTSSYTISLKHLKSDAWFPRAQQMQFFTLCDKAHLVWEEKNKSNISWDGRETIRYVCWTVLVLVWAGKCSDYMMSWPCWSCNYNSTVCLTVIKSSSELITICLVNFILSLSLCMTSFLPKGATAETNWLDPWVKCIKIIVVIIVRIISSITTNPGNNY